MHPLLVLVIDVELPGLRQSVFESGGGLERVRRVVVGIDQGSLISGTQNGNWSADNRAEGVHPAVLGQVVVVDAKANADDGVSRTSRRVSDANARRGLAVIVGNASGQC